VARAVAVAGVAALLSAAGAHAGGHVHRLDPGERISLSGGPARPLADADARVEPTVTLRLRVVARRTGTGAAAATTGTFRGRAGAGRPAYRLLPVGRASATHRHRTGAVQRARVERIVLDARSDREFLSVVGGGSVTGARGACRRFVFRYSVRPAARTAALRWSCRGGDGSPPPHVDVFRTPRDAIVSSYTITRRPCSIAHAGPSPCVESSRA
jgi:hypothetical protein